MNAFILVTGSRSVAWDVATPVQNMLDEQLAKWQVQYVSNVVLFHGGCPDHMHSDYSSVDMVADRWARATRVQPFQADALWGEYGNAAGPTRNQDMVTVAKGLIAGGWRGVALAFPTKDSKGTWDCVERIKAAEIPLKVCRL
jgi:hypothetical protein